MGDRSDHFPLPAFLHEEYRRAKESPEVVERERRIEAERERREELARVRRLGLEVLLPADSEWPRVASLNEDIETQR